MKVLFIDPLVAGNKLKADLLLEEYRIEYPLGLN